VHSVSPAPARFRPGAASDRKTLLFARRAGPLGDLALVCAAGAHQIRFQLAPPLDFGVPLEGLNSLRRPGLAAVETGLAEARTDQYAHGLPASLAKLRLVSPTYGEGASGRGL
jgi:hypothetical protein